jgi:REP element-mobilizing transposase RayT
MGRQSRQASGTGIHHAMVRGINRTELFRDEADYAHFIKTLQAVRDITQDRILSYCLMPNHVHLLLEESGEPISQFFQRLGVRYVGWFNHKYNRVGHLFQGRFKSKPVEDNAYFTAVISYIHNNPVKACLANRPQDYRWSSRHGLVTGGDGVVDLDRLTTLISLRAILQREALYASTDFDPWIEPSTVLSPEQASRVYYGLELVADKTAFSRLPGPVKSRVVSDLVDGGFTVSDVARRCGLPRTTIRNWLRRP